MTTPPFGTGAAGGPTVLRIILGSHLRRLRESRGITREQAGYQIRASESKISRMELGRVSFKERDVADLLTLYGVTDGEEHDRLLTLAQEANTPGWWQRYSDLLNNWLQPFIGLEAAASMIRTYEVQWIPGLLQTKDYARACIRVAYPNPEDLERVVEVRMIRQQVLTRPDPLQLWAVIDEGALHRHIGGAKVMQAQLLRLAELTKLPNVRIQVVPFSAGAHAAWGGPFQILRFAEPDLPDLVYSDQLTTALYLDKRDDLDQYAFAMETLCIEAAPPDESKDILLKLANEFGAED